MWLAAKVFEEIRKAIERSGQVEREFSKIDLSHLDYLRVRHWSDDLAAAADLAQRAQRAVVARIGLEDTPVQMVCAKRVPARR